MKNFKKISSFALLLQILLIPGIVLGQSQGTTPGNGNQPLKIDIQNPLTSGNSDFMSLLTTILNDIVMPIAAVAVVFWIIWAGFTYLMAQGKPAEIEKAHKRLLWSLVGAGILLGAGAISLVVQNTVQTLIRTS